MPTGPGLTRQRGGTQPNALTAEAVTAAAVRVIERSGLDALTVMSVANELGVTGPAVHHHVPGGKGMLVEMAVTRIRQARTLQLAERPDETWMETVERLLVKADALDKRYPGVLGYLLSVAQDETSATLYADFIVKRLLDSGFRPDGAAHALATINAFIIGWTLTRTRLSTLHRMVGSRPAEDGAGGEELTQLRGVLNGVARVSEADRLRVAVRAVLVGLQQTLLDGEQG
jgi:AcrR family transcriptional regulator